MINHFFLPLMKPSASQVGNTGCQYAQQSIRPSIYRALIATIASMFMQSVVFAASAAVVFERVRDSVFVVKVSDEQNRLIAQGSAVLLPSGKLATNCHLLKDGQRLEVGQKGRYVQAKRVAGDENRDACLLVADQAGGKPATIGYSSSLKVGAPVYAIGSPHGLELSMSDGIVSQLRGGTPPIIQITAAISPGSSGGGVFDSEGRLVGLSTLYIEGAQNLNFALPVEWLNELQPVPDKAIQNEPASGTRGHSIEDFSMHGNLLYEGRLLEARELAKAWVKAEPKNVDSWLALGLSHQFLKDAPNAVEAYTTATRVDQNHYGAWFGLGYNLIVQNKYDKAIIALRRAVEINPSAVLAWPAIGTSYLKSNRPSNAISPFQEAIKLEKDTHRLAEHWFGLGESYRGAKRYVEAIQAFQSATRIKPDDWRYWNALALSHIALSQIDESIKALGKAVSLNQNEPTVWATLGVNYAIIGDYSKALQVVSILRGLDPKRAEELDKVVSATMSRKR